ncbi:putative acid phosphatase [Kockovaella imperatae]|uniref:Putative acid phosphatase n=1 Tax=Kockovaella imperatae TaxID=4999 RepID=A0A1Y1ULP6_9TREE|nr:putative acid phosphatase [Kockovaella imperatae]ORX38978.1 putative acid phosphatase [Kockovaella imperatae]
MISAALLTLLPVLAHANPVEKRWQAETWVGSPTSNVYPPNGTSVNTALFPPESVVGYAGPTPTGIEPAAIQTASAYPYTQMPAFRWPLVVDQPYDNPSTPFDITQYWGNLSPVYSVNSSIFGLPGASPLVPDQCTITQVHILYRHGARYPTGGSAPAQFAEKLNAAANNGSTWSSWGDLDFLNHWQYGLGAEILTPFGRLQNFELGAGFRVLYGELLNNFTAAGTLPVFRTESGDRMVHTADNFAAGFFGVPDYLTEVNIELMVEANGVNNTGAAYDNCPNANGAPSDIGGTVAKEFAVNAFNSTLARLNSEVKGIQFTPSDAIAMLQLCAYETDAIGYSQFCKLFTSEDYMNFEYYYDLIFWYENGPGSPVSAAQGKGLAEELVARLLHQQITVSDSAVNSTLDSSPILFPVNNSIYADATHEVIVGDTLTALNLTAVFGTEPLSPTQRSNGSVFSTSRVFPFATHLVFQVLECPNMSPSKQGRWILNDGVIPIDQSHPGCPWNKDGLCPLNTIISALQNRLAEIDFNYACNGNYTYGPGNNYGGLAPKS